MMPGEAMLFLFAVVMAAILLFMMVFFVCIFFIGVRKRVEINLFVIGHHVF